MKPEGLPRMVGWVSLPEAASMLGISRQRAHQMLKEFTTACMAGTVIMVREAEVDAIAHQREFPVEVLDADAA